MPMSRHTTAARGVEVTFWNSAAGRVRAPLGAANRMFRAAIGISKNSGQGSASLTSPEPLASPCFLIRPSCLAPFGPGRLPACARFLRGVGRPANLFRISHLDRCAGSTRKRIEQNGLLSSSGVPSWGAKPDPRIEPGLESRKAVTGRQFSHLSVGQTSLASKEDQPGDMEARAQARRAVIFRKPLITSGGLFGKMRHHQLERAANAGLE
jgi:hypothetical protein